MQNKTELVFARVEPALKDSIRALARETGRDVSKTVRDAVRDYLARHGRWPQPERQAEGLKAA